MNRHLLILIVALGLAVPGIVGVTAAVTDASAAPSDPTSAASAVAQPSVTPTASPSPGDVTPPVTIATGVGSGWRNTAAAIELSATDDASGVAATVYRVDGGTWMVGTTLIVKAPKDHTNDGEHAVEFYSVDNALNAETPQTVTVKIDTRPPRLTWTGVSPGVLRSVRPVACRFTIVEPTGPVQLAYKVTDQYGYFAAGKRGLERAAGRCTLDVPTRYRSGRGFVPGVYRIGITVRDEAGNVTLSKPRPFRDERTVAGGVWHSVPNCGRMVALTFDDGDNTAWARILSVLERDRVHATFFPLGPYVASGQSLARRTIEDGDAIGTHGWTHTDMTRQSAGQIQGEWSRAAAAWWSAARVSPLPYCRPPYGSMDSKVTSASAAIGFYRVILWDVDPRDWSSPGASVIASRVLSAVHPGAIVCMHIRSQTAEALPTIIGGLKARGYKVASLPEMFHAAGMR
ncbi:MAG TPA: polysaccharide deacetylase family protein [Thermoleophilia bacterium]|nr:polysaccharide deacetylase family protein [Thermoleophilia bacterium]